MKTLSLDQLKNVKTGMHEIDWDKLEEKYSTLDDSELEKIHKSIVSGIVYLENHKSSILEIQKKYKKEINWDDVQSFCYLHSLIAILSVCVDKKDLYKFSSWIFSFSAWMGKGTGEPLFEIMYTPFSSMTVVSND